MPRSRRPLVVTAVIAVLALPAGFALAQGGAPPEPQTQDVPIPGMTGQERAELARDAHDVIARCRQLIAHGEGGPACQVVVDEGVLGTAVVSSAPGEEDR